MALRLQEERDQFADAQHALQSLKVLFLRVFQGSSFIYLLNVFELSRTVESNLFLKYSLIFPIG